MHPSHQQRYFFSSWLRRTHEAQKTYLEAAFLRTKSLLPSLIHFGELRDIACSRSQARFVNYPGPATPVPASPQSSGGFDSATSSPSSRPLLGSSHRKGLVYPSSQPQHHHAVDEDWNIPDHSSYNQLASSPSQERDDSAPHLQHRVSPRYFWSCDIPLLFSLRPQTLSPSVCANSHAETIDSFAASAH